ncbi:hypothetical protein MKW92_039179 [Papaver armeniacum]|nr:hypothetical protein MKW92_039179 [Papaver armeniacum]
MSSSSAKEMMKSKSFSQTCDLLSEYIKGNKASFGPPAINLASSAGISSSMGLFPQQHASLGATPNTEGTNNNKSESAQMTIFYGGKIMVLDNLTANNANKLLGFAENFSDSYIVNPQETSRNNLATANNILIPKDLLPPSQQQRQQQQQAIASGSSSSLNINGSDVPAAKNHSLQRFLAKRKERISARAPYQVKASSSTPEDSQARANKVIVESKTWLGLGPISTSQMEL